MRICHFCFSLDASKGGVPHGVFNVAKHLTKYGIKNQIVSTGNTKSQLTRNEKDISNLKASGVEFNYSIVRFQNNYGLGSLRGLNKMLTRMKKPDFIVLHQIYSFSTLLGYWYAKKNFIPYAVLPHGSLTRYHESKSRLIKTLAKWLLISRILREADAIIVTCESEKADLNPTLQLKACQLLYGATITVSKENFLSMLPVGDRNLRIIFSGRFDKKKNLPLLLKAMPEILKSCPDLVLDVAGSGTSKEVNNIKKIVTKLKISNHVKFHGWINQNEMSELFNSARLLVLPSSNENFALVVSESLSMGVPCVISKFVGTSDIVAKHHAGEIINDLTPSAIAAKVIKVLNGDENVYRAAALKAIREDLDWAKISMQWKKLIKDLAVE